MQTEQKISIAPDMGVMLIFVFSQTLKVGTVQLREPLQCGTRKAVKKDSWL